MRMSPHMTKSAIYTVRNHLGQFIGTYRAKTAAQAIQRARDEQAITASTFRKSQPALALPDLTAKIEETS